MLQFGFGGLLCTAWIDPRHHVTDRAVLPAASVAKPVLALSGGSPVGLRWEHRQRAAFVQFMANSVVVEGFVGDQSAKIHVGDQRPDKRAASVGFVVPASIVTTPGVD